MDVNVLGYDPRDHFDFAYVPEGWQRVQKRLASGSITDFSLAAHAIGDFYATPSMPIACPQRRTAAWRSTTRPPRRT